MISDNTLQAIKESVATTSITVGGVEYATRAVIDTRKKDPEIAALQVATLSGLVEYVKAHSETNKYLLHVEGFNAVSLVSHPWGPFKQREVYARATIDWLKGLHFGTYLDLESFNVMLQSRFIDIGDRAKVLALVGNLTDEVTAVVQDDGVTQNVTVRAGIVRRDTADVPNPVVLMPYRTFPEIDQPASPFILRLRPGKPPAAALFEGDGYGWKRQAVDDIKVWLGVKLPSVPVIG